MAARFVLPETAFSKGASRKQKRPRVKSKSHLAFIRSLPCIITGQYGVDAAHIRFRDDRYWKRATGKGEKPSDIFVLPLCREMHEKQHRHNERAWWLVKRIDPVQVAILLYIHSGNTEVCEQILQCARQGK